MPRFKETLAKIVDAQYVEPDEDDYEAGLYGSSIVLILRDLESDALFTAPLPQNVLSRIVRSGEELTTKKMIEFALALRAREAPVRVMMPLDGAQALTEEMIMATTRKTTRKTTRRCPRVTWWKRKRKRPPPFAREGEGRGFRAALRTMWREDRDAAPTKPLRLLSDGGRREKTRGGRTLGTGPALCFGSKKEYEDYYDTGDGSVCAVPALRLCLGGGP